MVRSSDRRGHGRSDDPGRGYTFDTLTDDLVAVLERRDLRGVTLVGHSMGCGEIARYLGHKERPQLIGRHGQDAPHPDLPAALAR